MNRRHATRVALLLLLMLAGALLVAVTYRVSYRASLADWRESNQRRLQLLSSDLASALDKFDTLPIVLSTHPQLAQLLARGSDEQRRLDANRLLERLAQETQVAAIYLMDSDGRTIAASNWNTPRSFVGQNYAFRPYFADAVRGGVGRFYAIGATTGEPGYFLARPVPGARGPAGVVAVKISLDDIEANWSRSGEWLMLADGQGVVFLSSRPEWKFRTLEPLEPARRERIRATLQYRDQPLQPLAVQDAHAFAAAGETRIELEHGRVQVAAQRRAIGRMDWTLLSLSPTEDIARLAWGHAIAAGFAFAFVSLGVLYIGLRRRRDEERRLARRELERANAELEQRIGERTAVLVDANNELAAKIEQLDRTQATLGATRDELIQAGKLTVLGQMAASITHEINQPLTALRALNDNAQVLLQRDELEDVRRNLQAIDGLTRRIAAIVAQLKGFGRKDDLQQVPVPVRPVVEAAMALVAADARHESVQIVVQPMDGSLAVRGQAVRIEQVLVNLLRNAIDAVRDMPCKEVRLAAQRDGDWVRLTLVDSGPGIAPEAMERLFEPFFTTKPGSQGLGLGLAISASIANALDGSLEAANHPGGGAQFTLRLHAAVEPAALASTARTIG